MNHFFKVQTLEAVLSLTGEFPMKESETIPVSDSFSRILAQDVIAPSDMPGFRRATMDGYAVPAQSTFGASESNPAWLNIVNTINMGDIPDFQIGPGESARISTGGMLPGGADAVVMVEYTETIDPQSVEIYKSVAPLQNVIDAAEDFESDQQVLKRGTFVRPQEQGLIAGLGIETIQAVKKPRVGIISTGDEIVPIDHPQVPGKIRDINSYALAGFIRESNAEPVCYGIVGDDPGQLKRAVEKAIKETDMVLISGGSSVGAKDYTIDVLTSLDQTRILAHGISISPGKPTILAKSGDIPVWGLPGQVTSAMVVFKIVVAPFLDRIKGLHDAGLQQGFTTINARLTRNISSAQGRRDFIRVKLNREDGQLLATPVLGKSGLIRTMILADGLLEISDDAEGLEQGTIVQIILM